MVLKSRKAMFNTDQQHINLNKDRTWKENHKDAT